MPKWNWNELFGEDFLIDFPEGQRQYFALNEIDSADISVFFSKTNLWYKRTTVFWHDNDIIKVIVEENRVLSDGTINLRTYLEYDTHIATQNREVILPITSKSKPKKLNATNILSLTPYGCSFSIRMDLSEGGLTRISVVNPRSCQRLAIGENKRISLIRNKEDFTNFLSHYIAACPIDYMDRIERLKSSKKVTVKYRPGDIFRVELDRFSYCYGLITGEVSKMRKLLSLPERHSLHSYMMVPIMVRFFDIVTQNSSMTAEELTKYPLCGVQICGDNDIIWGVHPITGRRNLTESDIDFNLICTKFISKTPNITVFSQDLLMGQGSFIKPERYDLYVEWGTACTELKFDDLTDKLKHFFNDFRSPFGGVSMGIYPNIPAVDAHHRNALPMLKYDLRNDANKDIRAELFSCLGLAPDTDFDDFAKKLGGMTKSEILKVIQK